MDLRFSPVKFIPPHVGGEKKKKKKNELRVEISTSRSIGPPALLQQGFTAEVTLLFLTSTQMRNQFPKTSPSCTVDPVLDNGPACQLPIERTHDDDFKGWLNGQARTDRLHRHKQTGRKTNWGVGGGSNRQRCSWPAGARRDLMECRLTAQPPPPTTRRSWCSEDGRRRRKRVRSRRAARNTSWQEGSRRV